MHEGTALPKSSCQEGVGVRRGRSSTAKYRPEAKIENHEDHGDLISEKKIRLSSSEPPLQLEERHRPARFPRENFSVKNRGSAELARGNCKFRKGFRDAPKVARKDFAVAMRAVNLRADAVEFVLDPNGAACSEPLPDCSAVGLRTGEHASDRLEQSQLSIPEATLLGKQRRPTNIAEEHVGFAKVRDMPIKGRGNGIFEQAFLEADAEISRENSNEIAGCQRRYLPEDTGEDLRFQERAACSAQVYDNLSEFAQRQRATSRSRAHRLRGSQSAIVVPAADCAKIHLRKAAGSEEGAADDGATHVERLSIALREGASCQPDDCEGKFVVVERAKVFGKPANLVEFSC